MAGKLKSTTILDGQFEVIGLVPGPVLCALGKVDLAKITVSQARDLLAINFPYLREVVKKPTRRKGKGNHS
jgi:hypothetical protein